jgi:cytoskeletal protein RodZ
VSQEPDAPPPSRPLPAPALNLISSRKLTSVTLEEISASTKISLRFLQAIENEEFDKLPGGIFSTSYLRQYAAAIGYDADALLAHYDSKVNPQSALAKGPQPELGRRLYRWPRTATQA